MAALVRSRQRLRAVVPMGSGVLLVGVAGYTFVAVAGHTLPPAEAAAVLSFYLLANIIGPGLFLGLEQEASHRVAFALARGASLSPRLRELAWSGAWLLVGVITVLGMAAPWLVRGSFTGHVELFIAGIVAAGSSAALFLVRGVLGGTRNFTGYSGSLASEGVMRLVPIVAVAQLSQIRAGVFGFVFVLGTASGALTGAYLLYRARPPRGSYSTTALKRTRSALAEKDTRVRGGLAMLAAASLLTYVVANLAPIVVTARLANESTMAAAFAAAFIMTRAPLLLFTSVQAVLLPTFSAAVVQGDHRTFLRRMRMAIVAVLVLGGLGIIGFVLAGPWAMRVLFGSATPLSGVVLGLLAMSTLLSMGGQVLHTALIALSAHKFVMGAWAAGTAVLIGLLLFPSDPVSTAVLAQLVSPGLIVLIMTIALFAHLGAARANEPVLSTVGADVESER